MLCMRASLAGMGMHVASVRALLILIQKSNQVIENVCASNNK